MKEYFDETNDLCDNGTDDGIITTVGMVGVATGSYSVDQLTEVAGETIPGIWEPIILKEGMKDPMQFINSCLYGKWKWKGDCRHALGTTRPDDA